MGYIRHNKKWFSGAIGICCFCLLVFALGGCSTLRRKFTRKKKQDSEESQRFIPVLEPVDYPEKTQSPLEKYKRHYSLWRVWDRDLLQAIDNDDSDKRQKYLLGQAVEQLEEMGQLLNDTKRSELILLITKLRKLEDQYNKPVAMRNTFSIKKTIERNSRDIRNGFAPDPAWLSSK
ncbi:MAG: hypothetical protein JW847_09105 [Candidatus Omnitrophica bacterium]|nr:hypothetical protein [Candidatus Omnitrophota bacterium]